MHIPCWCIPWGPWIHLPPNRLIPYCMYCVHRLYGVHNIIIPQLCQRHTSGHNEYFINDLDTPRLLRTHSPIHTTETPSPHYGINNTDSHILAPRLLGRWEWDGDPTPYDLTLDTSSIGHSAPWECWCQLLVGPETTTTAASYLPIFDYVGLYKGYLFAAMDADKSLV